MTTRARPATTLTRPAVFFAFTFAWLAVDAGSMVAQDRGAAWPRHSIDRSSRGADGVRLADVNGDGRPDVATGWEEGGTIRVCIHPGPEKVTQPWPGVTVGKVRSPEDAVLVDLDHDGAVDVVSCCEGKTRAVFVHWAPREPGRYLDQEAWRAEIVPGTADYCMWMFAVPMQVDNKHGIDLVVGGKGPRSTIGWLEAPRDPRNLDDWRLHPVRPAGWVMSLFAIDMDGDGDLDILASDRKGSRCGVFWLENPRPVRSPTDQWTEHPIGLSGREVMFIAAADLDRDGRLDVVAATLDDGLWFLRSAGKDQWQSHPIALPENVGEGKSVNVGDVDLDGRLDLVITCGRAARKSGAVWLAYRSAPTDPVWDAHEISGAEGTKFDLVELLDLDGDGDLDALTCEEAENLGVFWYENPTRGSGRRPEAAVPAPGAARRKRP